MALKLLPEDLSDVPAHLADRYEAQAGRFWDLFYRRNATKFFKDRHYLHKEFPDLAAGPATLLEVGCGVGNTVFPLREINPALKIYCCDFAPSAIELVRQNPQYSTAGGALEAFVADITSDLLAAPRSRGGCGVPEGGCDLATMIFVLSAIHPQKMAAAVHNVARSLKPGTGRLLFRDYAEGDLAQERLAGCDRPKRLGLNFYVRGDGTRCYYFSQPEVLSLFSSAGLECDSVTVHERTVVNHKRDIAMDRRWLQAIFTLRQYTPPPIPLRELLGQPAHPHQQPPQHHYQQQQQQQAPYQLADCDSSSGISGRGRDSGNNDTAMDIDVHNDKTALYADGQQTTAGGPPVAAAAPPLPNRSAAAPNAADTSATSRLYGSSWLTGAAGRLASHLAGGPGQPSGRALLPETLDSADDQRAQLSPSTTHPNQPNRRHYNHNHRNHDQHSQLPAPLRGGSHVSGWVGGGGGECNGRPGAVLGDMQVDGDDVLADGGGSGGGAAAAVRQRRRRSGGSSCEEDGGGGCGAVGGNMTLENELEAEFFATIDRDSAEVVAEEVAATGAALSRVRLVDLVEVAATRMAEVVAAAATSRVAGVLVSDAGGRGSTGAASQGLLHYSQHHNQDYQQHQHQQREVEVEVAAGATFRCLLCGPPQLPVAGAGVETGVAIPTATLGLARILLASPRLLGGKFALQLGPARLAAAAATAAAASAVTPSSATTGIVTAGGSSGSGFETRPDLAAVAVLPGYTLPAMAAIRGSARRVVISEANRLGLAAAATDLRRNAHSIVIERLRMATLDWVAAGASTASTVGHDAAAPTSLAAGYRYMPGAVRQLRDVLHMQPSGYNLLYAADPLSEVTSAAATATAAAAAGGGQAAAAAGPAGRVRESGEAVAITAARALFHVASQLVAGGDTGMTGMEAAGGGGSGGRGCQGVGVERPGLLLLCVPGAWAAVHGMGFAALAGVCGWELLVPEQLVDLYGVNVAAAAGLECAALGFRRRR